MNSVIDNFELIRPLLTFHAPDDSFYLLQIIQRKKEHPEFTNTRQRAIETYYITSLEKLDYLKERIVNICNSEVARAYINLNEKSIKKTVLATMRQYMDRIETDQFHRAYHDFTSCAASSGTIKGGAKRYVLDLDEAEMPPCVQDKSFDGYVEDVCRAIEGCDPVGSPKIIAKIPTLHGLHVITSPFNVQQMTGTSLLTKDDIKKNNPTLLYGTTHRIA